MKRHHNREPKGASRRTALLAAIVAPLAASAFLSGCASTKEGPIKPDTEDWEDLLDGALDTLEDEMRAEVMSGAERRRVLVYTGLENDGGNPMYDFQSYADAHVQRRLRKSDLFEVVDQRAVESGMRNARIEVAADIQYIKVTREKFLSVLQNEDVYPEYLMYARYTSLGANDADADSIRMNLTFTLCDKESGKVLVETDQPIKVRR